MKHLKILTRDVCSEVKKKSVSFPFQRPSANSRKLTVVVGSSVKVELGKGGGRNTCRTALERSAALPDRFGDY